MKTIKVWKVFSGSTYAYCYSKEAAVAKKAEFKRLGFTKVMTKRKTK